MKSLIIRKGKKWTEEDKQIENYFMKTELIYPITYLDVDTSFETSFRLSD
jgi:hypothetical protein